MKGKPLLHNQMVCYEQHIECLTENNYTIFFSQTKHGGEL